MRRFITHPFAALTSYSVVLTLGLIASPERYAVPSPTFELFATFTWTVLVVGWIVTDARRHVRVPCFDFGFLCLAWYPASMFWYCLRTRRLRGLLLLGLLVSFVIVPYLVALIVRQFLFKPF